MLCFETVGVAHWKKSLEGFVWVICYQARTSKHSTVSAIFLFPHIHKEMQREKEIKELWTGKVGFACLQQMPNMRSIFSTNLLIANWRGWKIHDNSNTNCKSLVWTDYTLKFWGLSNTSRVIPNTEFTHLKILWVLIKSF